MPHPRRTILIVCSLAVMALQELASATVRHLKPKICRPHPSTYPWLFVPDDGLGNKIKKMWMSVSFNSEVMVWGVIGEQDTSRLEDVTRKTGRSFKTDPLENVTESHVIMWTGRNGSLPKPFPGHYLIIVALEPLNRGNGLPVIPRIDALDVGGHLLLHGGEDIHFNGKDGGMAFLMVLRL